MKKRRLAESDVGVQVWFGADSGAQERGSVPAVMGVGRNVLHSVAQARVEELN